MKASYEKPTPHDTTTATTTCVYMPIDAHGDHQLPYKM